MKQTASPSPLWSWTRLDSWWASFPDEQDIDETLRVQGCSQVFHDWLLVEVLPRRTLRAQALFRQWQALQTFKQDAQSTEILLGLPLVVWGSCLADPTVSEQLSALVRSAFGCAFQAEVAVAPRPVGSAALHTAGAQALRAARAGDWSALVPSSADAFSGPCVWLFRLGWATDSASAQAGLNVLQRPAFSWSCQNLQQVHACLKTWGQRFHATVDVLPVCPFWDAAPLAEMACLRSQVKKLGQQHKPLSARFSRTGHIELLHEDTVVYRQFLPSQTAEDIGMLWQQLKTAPRP
jgi:hypothetical protein